MKKHGTKIIIALLLTQYILFLGTLIYIWNTDYTFCFKGQDGNIICSHQKIGDYLLGKE